MSFTVTLLPSGRSFLAGPDDTVLNAGLKAGINLPYSCRTGVCSTCKCRIERGEIEQGFTLSPYLPAEERQAGYVLICSARPRSDLVIEVEEVDTLAAIKPKIWPVRVVEQRLASPDVMLLKLRLPMNETLQFVAGQYVEMQLADGDTRCYSIAHRPDVQEMPYIELHVRHVPGGKFTDRLFAGDFKAGMMLRLEAPLGTFFLRPSDQPAILLASGTGFAPIKAIVEDAMHRDISRPLHVYWGGRKKTDLYMDALVREWAERYPNLTYTPVLSEPTESCAWTGRSGLVHRAVMADWPDMQDVQVYACGTPLMVESARGDFRSTCGLPAAAFFADSFLTEREKAIQTPAEA